MRISGIGTKLTGVVGSRRPTVFGVFRATDGAVLRRGRQRGGATLTVCVLGLLGAFVPVLPGSEAQGQPPVPEWKPGEDPLAVVGVLPVAERPITERSEPEVPGEVTGTVYTWRDGEHVREALLQEDLVLVPDEMVSARADRLAQTVAGSIVRVDDVETDGREVSASSSGDASVAAPAAGPVFRSRAGILMALPGGVVLLLDREWTRAEVRAFLESNGLNPDRVSVLGGLPNAFLVETEPGFPSLELANSLAGQPGVRVASPNWWQEHRTR